MIVISIIFECDRMVFVANAMQQIYRDLATMHVATLDTMMEYFSWYV